MAQPAGNGGTILNIPDLGSNGKLEKMSLHA